MTLKHSMLGGTARLRPTPRGAYKQRDSAWYAGKLTQRTIPHVSDKRVPSHPGSDIYTDIVGPFPVPTREGHRYFVLYKDAYTQHSAVYLIKLKDELLDTRKMYLQDMRVFSPAAAPTTIGILHYPDHPQFLIHDDDQLYVAGGFAAFNRDQLVGQWTIAPYTHSANPAEPAIRRILEAATASLHRSGFPPSFALYAVQHAVQGINRCFTPVHYRPDHRYMTPHQRRLNVYPHIDDLPPFGALAYVHIPRDDRKKCEDHSWSGFYAGPPRNMNGFRIYRPLVNKIYDRYHVVFDSTIYYGDFMGEVFRQRVRADILQRQYYNQEVEALIGSPSNPLSDLLNQRQWHTLPTAPPPPADVPRAPAAAPTEATVRAASVRVANPALEPSPRDTAATIAARMRAATQPHAPTPQRTTRVQLRRSQAHDLLGGVAPAAAAAMDTYVPGSPAPDTPMGSSRATAQATPSPRLSLSEPPQTAATDRTAQREQPLTARAMRAAARESARAALLHSASIYAELFDYGVDFSDVEFLADVSHSAIDDTGIAMLQLHADATRLRLDEATSRALASTAPPTTQRQIDALAGTTEGHLVREAQVDEVMSMIREGRVIPRDLRTLSHRINQIDGKWVIKYKKQLDGLLERVRARWTLRGDRQIPHRDFDPDRVYSPVASKTTHYTLFVLAVQFGLHLWCLDVSKAFMLGPIDKPGLYMRPPAGFRDKQHPDYCPFGQYTTFELLCSLYGLRQAAAVYYDTMKQLLLSHSFSDGTKFRLSPADPCLFIRGSVEDPASPYVAVTIHVDDKFIACRRPQDKEDVAAVFRAAKWNFTLKLMDEVLGVHITYQRWDPAAGVSGLLEADHKQYLIDAYKKYSPLIPADRRGTSYAIPLSSATVSRITAAGQCSYEDYDATRHTRYRSILGTLSHVANFTHPEMAFAISFASQYMQNPSEAHLEMLLNILLYAYAARDKVVRFRRQTHPPDVSPIMVACDADLSNSKNCRSRTGFCAYLFGMLVAWHSRLQPSVSLSTAESEYMAISAAARFAVWYRMLVGDFGVQRCYRDPVHIFSDNKSAICIANNPITHKHSRHIDRRLHWLREQCLAGAINVVFISTEDNVADIMTKALKRDLFRTHRTSLMRGYYFTAQLDGLPKLRSFVSVLTATIAALDEHDMLCEL